MRLKQFDEIDDKYIEEIHEARGGRISFIKDQINECIRKLIGDQEALVYAVGSDGRKENRPKMSPGELLLIIERDNMITSNKLIRCLRKDLNQANQDTTMSILSHMEIQQFDNNNLFYYPNAFQESNHIFFPTRFLDSHLLFGKEEANQERQSAYIKNLSNVSSESQRDWRRRVNLHKNISNNGYNIRKQERQNHFDTKGIYYTKSFGIEAGIKLGPLRYLQYSIVKKIVEEKGIGMEAMFGKTTKEKVNLLRGMSLLKTMSEEDEQFLVQAYYYFLHIHHSMQTEFVSEKKTITYGFISEGEKNDFFDILRRFNSLIGEKI